MASITIDNLQPMVEYEELSGAELESVIGGIPWVAIGAIAAVTSATVGTASLALAAWSGAMAR